MTSPTTRSSISRFRDQRGSALIIALMATLLLTALGLSLVLTTSSETILSSNYRGGQEALYAAEAGLERAMIEIPAAPDVDSLLSGTTRSTFTDGSPGSRNLPNGMTLDLTALTNTHNCGKVTACSVEDMNAVTAERRWGANNPRWQLYAHGPLNNLLPGGDINSPYYVVVWVGDDPAETDNDPTRDDSLGSGGPGRSVVVLRAEAFGPFGSRKVLEATVHNSAATPGENGYSAQRGQDEQNRRSRSAAVGTPGGTLANMKMNLGTGGMAVQ